MISSLLSAQSAEKVKKQTLDSVNECNSNAFEIINQEDADNIKKYMINNGVSYLKNDFISGLGTTVHECLHGYDNDLSKGLQWDDNTYPIAYFIDKDIVISFQGKRLFKTDKLHNSFFPKEIKNMFRYGTYIYSNGPADASSNQWGIYGLLEEFNAYYHDIKAQIEYYNCNYAGNKNELMFGNEINAYYEFNTFMAYYLLYAKKYKKDDYEYIMSNIEMRKAYSLIEVNWQSLLTEVFQDRDLGLRFADLSMDAKLYNTDLQEVMNDFKLPSTSLSEYQKFLNNRKFDMSIVEKNLSWAGSNEVFTLFSHDAEGVDWSNDEMDMDVSMNITFKNPNYSYVTVLITTDPDKILEVFMNPEVRNFTGMGVFADEKGNLHVYLNKFDNKTEAQDLLNEVKNEFPKAKIE